ncbi:YIP1 family protein [Aliiroseovarius lamellibrachiae]|uniref:YIP1 family protein n=1 Tax=Aliiroseovarius lamellibrachiae TaxID=1924933 RepID=UPI001BE1037C|nr:YIP1 family protein [Aliiroseovarius lamellibrachiae]MBT2132079.1 hypothetical protein [Aliiroseovarius lamellibrachiae]
MQFTPGYLFGMVLQTIPEPRKVARDLFDLPVARKVRWLVLLLMVVLATILGVIEGVFLSVGVWAIYLMGRMAGGQGRLDDAITIAIWLEFVLLGFQTVTLVFSLFAPAMAGILMVMSSVLFFWILSHFTAESHGFRSAGLVFVSIITVLILAVFALSFLLVLMGVEPIEMGV